MKKITLTLAILSSLSFANDLEKQIPEIFNKMLEQFDTKKSTLNQNIIESIVKNFKNDKLVFCETKYHRSIISKKKNWSLDKENKIFINLEKEIFYYMHECKVFEDKKVYL